MAHVSVLVGAETAADIEVVLSSGTERPFTIDVQTSPTSVPLYLGRGAATAVVAGLMELLTADDPNATGELLDRLVAIVATS